MEFNTSHMDGLFAATDPLEALKLLVLDAATVGKCLDSAFKEESKDIMVNDVARAFFEAPVDREMAVELPEEDGGRPGCPKVGLLQKSLYSTRAAAANFQKEIQKFMKDQGFQLKKYNASTYFHAGRGLKVMAHGDDFVSSGTREHLQWLRSKLEQS